MEIKNIIIILLIYYLFFSKISENFVKNDCNLCLSTIAGRRLWQKESLDKSINSAREQKICLDEKIINKVVNKFQQWNDTKKFPGCIRFLTDTKKENIIPDKKSAMNWFTSCIIPLHEK